MKIKSTYVLRALSGATNPLRPYIVVINEKYIEVKRRGANMIMDTSTLMFSNIIGVDVDNHIFGATITIKSTDNDIRVKGLSKKKAKIVKEYIMERI